MLAFWFIVKLIAFFVVLYFLFQVFENIRAHFTDYGVTLEREDRYK